MGDRDVVIPISAPGADRAAADINKVAQSGSLLATAFGKVFGADSGASLLQFGKLFAGAGVVTTGLRGMSAIVSALKGDGEGFVTALEKLPFGLGAAVQAAHGLISVLGDGAEQAERIRRNTEGVTSAMASLHASFATAGGASPLSALAIGAERGAALARMFGAEKDRAGIMFGAQDAAGNVVEQLNAAVKSAADARRETLLKGFGTADDASVNKQLQDTDSLNRMMRSRLTEKQQALAQNERGFDDPGGANHQERLRLLSQIRNLTTDLDTGEAKQRMLERIKTSADSVFASESSVPRTLAERALKDIFTKREFDLAAINGSSLRGAGPAIEGRLLTGAGARFDPQMQSSRPSVDAQALLRAEESTQDILRQILSKVGPAPAVAGP